MTDKEKFRKEVEKLKSNLIHGACSSQVAMETRCKEEAYNEVLAILDTMQKESVSIWHDANEKPIKGKIILVVQDNGFPFVCDVRNDIGYVSLSFDHSNKTKIDGKDKWAYIEDLLNLSNIHKTIKNWKEPVSEELEKVSDKYSEDIESDYSNDMFDRGDIMKAFEAGAKWQKTKNESTTEDLGEYIDKLSKQFPEVSFAKLSRIAVRVAKWQKEQMMAKAKSGTVQKDNQVILDNGTYIDLDPSMQLKPSFVGLKEGDRIKLIVIKED